MTREDQTIPMQQRFPMPTAQPTIISEGMSLRDWFAAQALVAIITATADADMVDAMATGVKGGALETQASYAWADAMLAERAKK